MNLFEKLVKSSKSLTEKLLEEVSDIDIYCELAGVDFDIGKPISSPLRDDDDSPSFSLFIPTKIRNPRPEEVWWRDFARGSGSVFEFIKQFASYRYDLDLETRRDIVEFIDNELQLGIFNKGVGIPREKRFVNYEKAKESKEILFKSREFTRMDKYWWIQYGIDVELLTIHDVRSVHHLIDEDFTVKHTFGSYDLAFAYVIQDKVKLYCPTSTTFKWRNTCPSDYLIGAAQCVRNDLLIITKSMKDIMVFKSFMYCDAISPQAENVIISTEIVKKIKDRYKYIFVVMDYDPAGIEAAEKLENYGFKVRWVSQDTITVNGKSKVINKDISDYVKNKGIIAGLKRMKNMFSELPPNTFRDDRVKLLLQMKEELSK